MSLFNIPLDQLAQHLINGLTLGAIYALIALGYTMVYGILKFINFAHGEILMMGTYAGLYCFGIIAGGTNPGWRQTALYAAAIVAGMAVSAILGVAIERVAYKPLRKAPRLAPLLSAIGVSIVLVNIAALLFGTEPKRFEYPFDNTALEVKGISITPHQIMVLGVSFILMILLKLFIDRTRLGKAMRATSENQDVAALMGINVNVIISLTFAIGSSLAAVAGILTAMEYKVYPTMGTMAGLKAFIAAVVGGIGNITGAMVGGVILGILETLGVVVFGIPQGLKDTIAFSLLIIILLVKPAGIFGKNTREKV
jgi:branched-chain amino acid transport system permease protein